MVLSFLLLPEQPPAHVFTRIVYWDDDEDDEEDEVTTTKDIATNSVEPTKRTHFLQRKEDLINLCFNLVVFDSSTSVFRFAHTSVQEYLLEHSDSIFSSQEVNYARVAEHCISIMLQVPDRFCDDHKVQFSGSDEAQNSQILQDGSPRAIKDEKTSEELWYVQLPPVEQMSPREEAMLWTRKHWAYFVVNSGNSRQSPILKGLENDLDQMFIKQPWASVRSRLYFSACWFGLTSFVKSWTRAHPRLIKTRQSTIDGMGEIIYITALERAYAKGHKEVAEILIDNGADIDNYSKGCSTTNPLIVAVSFGHDTIVQLLLERGASTELDGRARVRYPLHYAISVGGEKCLSLVKILVEYGIDKDVKGSAGLTPIVRAMTEENLEVMDYLLGKGAKTILSTTQDGVPSVLHWSIIIRSSPEKSLAMAKLAVRYGADVNYRVGQGNTPIQYATRHKNIEVMKLILDNGGDINAQDSLGRTSLISAIQIMNNSSHDQSEVCLGPIADAAETKAVFAQGPDSRPVVRSESDEGYIKAIELLITRAADIHIKDNKGWNALNIAAGKGHENIVRLLFNHRANVMNRTKSGWSPVLNAAHEGHEPIVKLLLLWGAKLNVVDNNGWTALHCAVEKGNINILPYLVSSEIKVDETNAMGWTALLIATANDKVNSVRELLRLRADPNAVNHHGTSALSHAAEQGYPEIFRILLPITTNINTQDTDGDTALSAACGRSPKMVNLPIIDLLLNAGAEIAPRTPGPHCSFLDPAKRMEDFALDALLKAWRTGNHEIIRAILESATKRDPDSNYAKVLKISQSENMDALRAWMEDYKAKATGKRPDVVAFRERLQERRTELNDVKRQKGTETGLIDAVNELDIKED